MKSNHFTLIVFASLAAVLLAACGGAPSGSQTVAPAEFTITATDIAYDLTDLSVRAGQPVEIALQNEGALVHDFSISAIPVSGEVLAEEGMGSDHSMMADHDMAMEGHGEEPAVHVAAAPSTTGTVSFTPSAAGTYEYYCTVEGHKEAGMVGTLVVTE